MGLQLWLPLVRDLSNQGLSSATPDFNANNSSIVANGKLGNCLKTTAIGEIDTNCNVNINTSSLSFGGWYKFNKAEIQAVIDTKTYTSTNKTSTGNLIGNDNYGGIGLIFTTNDLYTNNKVLTNLYVFSTLRTSTVDQSTSSKTIEFDVWTHLFMVWDRDNLTLSFYVNGELFNSKTFSTFSDATTRNLFINYTHIYSGNGVAISPPSYVNDLRIYDHALSTKEVKLLSQGLVAHYKLTGALDGINPNMLKETPKSYTPTAYCGYQLNFTENLVAGETYTMQLWDVNVSHAGKTESTLGVNVYWGGGSVSLFAWQGTNYFTDGHSDYLSKTFTVTSSQASGSGATNLWFNIYNSVPYVSDTMNMSIGRWKLEKGSIATPYVKTAEEMRVDETVVYDCSGYNYHGQTWAYDTNGDIEISSSTPRYSVSTFINSASNTANSATGTRYIYCPCALTTPSYLSVAFWLNPSGGYGGQFSQGQFCLTMNDIGNGAGSDYSTAPMHNRDTMIDMCTSGSTHKTMTFAITGNEWHHYAITYDGRYGRVYKDSVEVSSLDMGSTVSLASMKAIVIGFSKAGGVWRKNQSKYSDFRLYATCLSAEDIKSLYQVGASIDKSGNMYAYEFNEV